MDLLSLGTLSIIWRFQSHHFLTADWPSLMQRQQSWTTLLMFCHVTGWNIFRRNLWLNPNLKLLNQIQHSHSTEKWRDWNFLAHKWPVWRTLTEMFLDLANIWKTYFLITEPLRAEHKRKHWQECQRSHLSGQAHSRQFQKNVFRSCMWMKMKHTAANSKSILSVTARVDLSASHRVLRRFPPCLAAFNHSRWKEKLLQQWGASWISLTCCH